MRGTIGGILIGVMLSTPQGKEVVNQGTKVLFKLGENVLKSQGIDLKELFTSTTEEDEN